MPTLDDKQIQNLITFRPRTKRFFERRLHLTVSCCSTPGRESASCLQLHVADVNLDNCIVKLDGKGRRQRPVPFAQEVRKEIFPFPA